MQSKLALLTLLPLSFTDQLLYLYSYHKNSCVKTSSAPNEIHRLQVQVSLNVNFIFLMSDVYSILLCFPSLHCLFIPPYPHLRLAKSTLTLIPLLGIHQVFFIFVTDESTKGTIGVRLAKLFIDLFFSSFQVRIHGPKYEFWFLLRNTMPFMKLHSITKQLWENILGNG